MNYPLFFKDSSSINKSHYIIYLIVTTLQLCHNYRMIKQRKRKPLTFDIESRGLMFHLVTDSSSTSKISA